MKKAYRITVIGAGDRGGTYMRMLDKYYKGQVVMAGICDLREDRMDKAFTDFGFESKNADWRKAIDQSNPDIVIVATPAYFHCDMSAYAMEKGCDVLQEKPFDLDMKKCFALKETAERTGKVLGIGLQYRNMKCHRAVKHMFEQNLLGDNRIVAYNDVRETRPKIAMHDAKFGNGGPMVDMACHLFDLMRWYYGSDPVSVHAPWRSSAKDRPSLESIEFKAPDTTVMTVTYGDGSLGMITMNWGLPKKVGGDLLCYAVGQEGLVNPYFPHSKQDSVSVLKEGGETMKVETLAEEADELENSEKTVFDKFIDQIEGTGSVQASFEEGIVSLATSMAAIKSGALGRPVMLAEILEKKPTILECMLAKEE